MDFDLCQIWCQFDPKLQTVFNKVATLLAYQLQFAFR